MQDPSEGVPHFLIPHVHLISSCRYPVTATLPPESVVDHLLQAPKIVKDVAPMYWHYFSSPPPDGTVLLEWQPPTGQKGLKFASDGYLWADPETTFTYQSPRGYTIEILIHRSGYHPGFEQVTVHQRSRYRIVNKHPSSNGPIFDQSLWIVHYSQSEPQARVPVARIPINAEMQRTMTERRFLESQGQLIRKEFMLHDRHKWPNISFPGIQPGHAQPGAMYAAQPMQQAAGFRQPPFYPQGQGAVIGPSPAKRPRQIPPTQMPGTVPGMPPTGAGLAHDTSIEDEENTAIGDLLDHLTPRDISTMRYTQHHEWMEEIFSSPYAAGQIMPVDLGLGLMGELSQLTEGLFDSPGAQSVTNPKKVGASAKPYQKLGPEKYKEFETRVNNFMKDGEAELERMKAEHAKKMEDLTRSKTYIEAERRLREALLDDSRGARKSSKDQEIEATATSTEPVDSKVDGVARDVEKALEIVIAPRKNVNCLEKGGLMEESPQAQAQANNSEANGADAFTNSGEANGGLDDTSMDGDNTVAGLLEQYTSNSLVSTPGGSSLQMPSASQPEISGQSATAASSGTAAQPSQATTLQGQGVSQGQTDLSGADSGMDLIEGIDLDVDMTGMGGDLGNDRTGDEWVMVDQNNHTSSGTEAQQKTDVATGGVSGNNDNNAPTTSSANQEGNVTSASASAPQTETTPGMFDTTDFSAFDTAGDALADYTGGDDLDLGLEGDAFGDAFHGTETRDHDDDGTNT
ncbi:uncharacterized protein K452DRAFT_293839 [Aplosporella prunicola CBS 121167]|uniref:DUF1750-domain-containing protein n=1 Tax=Aplosporella prunicola CBS 121167 TaxID=1176127 RepID=A0A6A6BVV5_9PEZI|nr:uncharacterized protein K452DRAFT_293839 [Aplosporella prunicola CBS 121167]KAF2147415.1 hypothetical protein K452DRAFT_293839 [Aplosporella prunicola CBS 121167]